MKKKKLSFGNIKDELSRDELKNIMAGSGSGGNIYCSLNCNGHSYPCDKSTLEACTDWCIAAWGDLCCGCAQF